MLHPLCVFASQVIITILLVRVGGTEMAKQKQVQSKAATVALSSCCNIGSKRIPVSKRKLETRVVLGLARKAPKFVVIDKHTVIYEK